MDVFLEKIDNSLSEIKEIKNAVRDVGKISTETQQRVAWIERQLATLIRKLEAMQIDLTVGLSIQEMGFINSMEMQDFLQDLRTQISQLGSLAKAIRIDKGIDL